MKFTPEELEQIAHAAIAARELIRVDSTRYADATQSRFPIYTPALVSASFAMYSNATKLKESYTDEDWKTVGDNITAAQVASAAHDEAEDVTLVIQAMTLVRELISREAQDGRIDDTYELRELVCILSSLSGVKYDEEYDVVREEYEKKEAEAGDDTTIVVAAVDESTTEEVLEHTTEGELMAIAPEDLTAIAEAVSTAIASRLESSNETLVAALANPLTALATAVAALAPAATVAVAEATDDEEAEAAKKGVNPFAKPAATTPVVDPKAKPVVPPAKAKASEDDNEEVAAVAEVAAVETVTGTPAEAVAIASGAEVIDGGEDVESASSGGSSNASLAGALTTYDLTRTLDRDEYIRTERKDRELAMAGLRIPVGTISIASGTADERKASNADLLSIFSRN